MAIISADKIFSILLKECEDHKNISSVGRHLDPQFAQMFLGKFGFQPAQGNKSSRALLSAKFEREVVDDSRSKSGESSIR